MDLEGVRIPPPGKSLVAIVVHRNTGTDSPPPPLTPEKQFDPGRGLIGSRLREVRSVKYVDD